MAAGLAITFRARLVAKGVFAMMVLIATGRQKSISMKKRIPEAAAGRGQEAAIKESMLLKPVSCDGGGRAYCGQCRPSALERKTAICARVTGVSGQKLPPPQPEVMELLASASICWNAQ